MKKIGFILLLGMFLFSCHQPWKKEKTIVIGAIYPISGKNKASIAEIINGIELAKDIINNNYDLPLDLAKNSGLSKHDHIQIRIVYRDFGDNPSNVIELVDDLVKNEKADILVGCYTSSATTLASERAEVHKVPFVNFDSTSPILNKRGLNYFFRTTPDDEQFSAMFFDFLNHYSQLKKVPKRIALIYENTLWGTGVANSEIIEAGRNGYDIIADIPYETSRESFDSEMEVLKNKKFVLLQASYDLDAVNLVNTYRRNNVNPVAIIGMNAGFISPYFIKNLKSDAEYIFTRDIWSEDLCEENTLTGKINAIYQVHYNHSMDGNSTRSFTGIMAIATAINESRSLKTEDILTSLRHLKIPASQIILPWDGIEFDNSGQNIKGRGLIVQIQKGQYRIVWPLDKAKTTPIFPR